MADIATSVHRDRFGCWAFLDLWRAQEAAPFSAAELEFLHSIAGPLTTALRHSQAAAFAAARTGEQASAGPVVLLLSPALAVRAQTPQTQRYLRLLVPPVSIETTSPGGRVSLFARASGLSSREAELLGHLVAGADTRDMARLMFLSQHTVQDHLKSIFAKTATRTRRTLLTRVLGT